MFDRIGKALADRVRTHARKDEEWRAFNYEVWRSGLQGALAKGLPEEEIARYRAQVRRYAPSGASPADERKAEMVLPIWYLM